MSQLISYPPSIPPPEDGQYFVKTKDGKKMILTFIKTMKWWVNALGIRMEDKVLLYYREQEVTNTLTT